MGVKGLYSLLEQKTQIYEHLNFRDSKLVVDGNNLVYHLYFTSNLDQNHGGEYLAFQAYVRTFFTTLADCGIKPYVVMDGGSGTSDIKLETLMERYKAKVLKAHEAASTGRQGNILPTFTKYVFRQTLSDMNVPLVNCFGEADGQLAALAKEWCCPVLSKDSDFYIFDLPAGLLPIDHFRVDAVRKSHDGSYIPCKRYTTSKFCTFFKINRQLLPVFASLGGNDYVDFKGIQWTQFLPGIRQREKSWTAGLEGLLIWLKSFQTPEDALTAVMALMPDMSMTNVQTKVREAMKEYDIPGSTLTGFFSQGPAPPLPAEMLSCIPDWVRKPLARGDLSGDVMDVMVHKMRTLPTQVEHSCLPSSNLTSQPLRQVLYGLLLGQRGEVEEVYRVGLELTKVKVQPVVQGDAQKLRLDCLPQVELAVRLQVCLGALGVKKEMLKGVPDHLHLPVSVTRYWLKRANPESDLTLKALLMVMVQGELNRQQGLTTGWQGDTKHISQPPDRVVAHSFNQWQACLVDASQLNLLLCMPLKQPYFAWFYQGRLVHQRVKQLQQKKPEEILPTADFRSLYSVLLEAVLQPDPGANMGAGGAEAPLTARMGHLHLNTPDGVEGRKQEREELE